MLPGHDIEQRIARLQQLVSAGVDTGYYPRSLLTTGRQQDDREEYGTRYSGRQARPPVSHTRPVAASGAP